MRTATTDGTVHRTWHVEGQVQGVGFRPFVYRLATDLELSGTVSNDPAGVTVEAWGPPARLDELERRLVAEAPALARIDTLCHSGESVGDAGPVDFTIVESDHAPTRRGRVTVDSAVCADCLRELCDPSDRRCHHALINCTSCGPRYTIVRDLPYDRPLTTMAKFPMCGPCADEYGDPADRRFHAQPTCCPACGPQLSFVELGRGAISGDPTRRAAALLARGGIVAMKGLGGYHLVVDAGNEAAVARLRRGKKRDHKPFAIMVGSVEEASSLVDLSSEGRTLLTSPISPIVLAPRRDRDGAISSSVAPDARRLGVMVPYTPMQHLLLEEIAGPLVMTSANLSDDPLISDDDAAERQMCGIADALLRHDRPIERAVDDSIVIDASFGILPLRRARGYVPTPLPLPVAAERPGLCVGGELKCTVAVVTGGQAILSQHLGDLTYALAYERFEQTIEDLLRLFDVAPRWIACDAHPQYVSHRHARRRAEAAGLDLLVVQHHHAHLASVLADHGRSDTIVGLVCDGVGYGEDGTAWGGEVLVGNLAGFARAGRLRPLRLPGGDAAARCTGRCAASWLRDALGREASAEQWARRVLPDDAERRAVDAMLDAELNCPPSSGMGRLFDAVAALLGLCSENHFEAMSGMAVEAAASRAGRHPSGAGIVPLVEVDGVGFELDHRPLARQLCTRIEAGDSIESLAWVFHDALADALARAAVRAAGQAGVRTVGLSGGVFCNTLLTELLRSRLRAHGLEVLVHKSVPPNDGGLALGQAAIAAASPAAGAVDHPTASGIHAMIRAPSHESEVH
ncbi:MAG: carbamoyltransferase HypF [Planctomycetota bacterium]|jgi:hydrogenase maturation protein HypF